VSLDSSFARFLPPSIVAVVAVLALLLIALPAVGALTAARTRAAEDVPGGKHARYARTMLVLWTMTAIAIYALALYGEGVADVGVRAPTSPLWYFAGPLVPLILLNVYGRRGGRRVNLSDDYRRKVARVIPTTASDWYWFVPVAATAALCEEFLYRGYAVTQIAALTHNITAGVVVSSIAFGLGHAYQGRMGMAGTAIIGLIYAGLFLISGSLAPCVLAHFLQDIVGARLLSQRLSDPTPQTVGPTLPAGE
jgi:uncharacterized protein